MSRKAKDLLNRVGRTFGQGALGVFALTYAKPLFDLMRSFASLGPGDQLPKYPDLTFWRNMLLALFAGGIIALFSLIHNWINDYLGFGGTKPILGKPVDRALGDQALGETKP
jgi:hypothetical protein